MIEIIAEPPPEPGLRATLFQGLDADGDLRFFLGILVGYKEDSDGPTWDEANLVAEFMADSTVPDTLALQRYWVIGPDKKKRKPKSPAPDNVLMFDPNRKVKQKRIP